MTRSHDQIRRHKNRITCGCPQSKGGLSRAKIAEFVYPLWASQRLESLDVRRIRTTLEEVNSLLKLVGKILNELDRLDLFLLNKKHFLQQYLEPERLHVLEELNVGKEEIPGEKFSRRGQSLFL